MPYCETWSKPPFQTKVTSQAFVACSLHERNAETYHDHSSQFLLPSSYKSDVELTALPPTDKILNLGGDGAMVEATERGRCSECVQDSLQAAPNPNQPQGWRSSPFYSSASQLLKSR